MIEQLICHPGLIFSVPRLVISRHGRLLCFREGDVPVTFETAIGGAADSYASPSAYP